MNEKEKNENLASTAPLWQSVSQLTGERGSQASFVLTDRATVPSTQGHDAVHSYGRKLGVVWHGMA